MKKEKKNRTKFYQEAYEKILTWAFKIIKTGYSQNKDNLVFQILFFIVWPLAAIVFLFGKRNTSSKKKKIKNIN